MTDPLEVCKIGGSLLNLDDPSIVYRLRQWIATRTSRQIVIITGGGLWADVIRRLDRCYGLSNEEAHWLAIRAMGLTSYILSILEPSWPRMTRWQSISSNEDTCIAGKSADRRPRVVIFDPLEYLREVEQTAHPAEKLPNSWDVTSDSIAAHLAVAWGGELSLMKSTSCQAISYRDAADRAFVDPYFPQAAQRLDRVRIVYWEAGQWQESYVPRGNAECN